MSDGPYENTDRELWRERLGDHYADSIHVTKSGSIGINRGGHVIVMPLRAWHALAVADNPPTPHDTEVRRLRERVATRKHWPDCAVSHGRLGCCDMGPDCGTEGRLNANGEWVPDPHPALPPSEKERG